MPSPYSINITSRSWREKGDGTGAGELGGGGRGKGGEGGCGEGEGGDQELGRVRQEARADTEIFLLTSPGEPRGNQYHHFMEKER